MKHIFTFLFFFCAAANSSAQARIMELSSEYNSQNQFVITAKKFTPGSVYLEIEFSELSNGDYMKRSLSRTLKSGGEVLKISPISRDSYPTVRYSYRCWQANPEAAPDTSFVYRLPYSQHIKRKVTPLRLIGTADKRRNVNWYSLQFSMQPGDTIYAARMGNVIEVTKADPKDNIESLSTGRTTYHANVNEILVEHEDGTYARYSVLDSVFVREGDRVNPATPLGLSGSYDGAFYQTRLSIYSMKILPKTAINSQTTFEYHYIHPVFSTTVGEIELTMHEEYQPAVSVDLITKEMSKREARKYQEK